MPCGRVMPMAIIKMVNVRLGKIFGLKVALDYVSDGAKTWDGLLVSAKDCMAESALEQMTLTKIHFNQQDGRQYVHFIQSFSLDDKLTHDTAHKIGCKLLEQFEGFQGIVATHTNEQHIHNHFILNSVNFENGRKWQMSKSDLFKLRERSDELCRAYGLSVIKQGNGWKSYGEYARDSWKKHLSQSIADSLEYSTSRQEFIHAMHDKGIEVDFGRTNIMFTMPDGKKCGNMKLMAYDDFTRKNIESHWKNNHSIVKNIFDDPRTMFEALFDLSRIFDTSQDDLMERFYANRMTALEGQALREWILKHKDKAGYIDYEAGALKRQLERQAEEQQKNGSILITITAILEAIQQDFATQADYVPEWDEQDWEL